MDCEQFKFTAEAQRAQSKTILGINELNKGILGTGIGLLSEKRGTIHCGLRRTGRIYSTAEAQRAQSKPNEDKLTSKKYRNKFDVSIKNEFFLF